MFLEHESEWSNNSGMWYMPILTWREEDEAVRGKLLAFTGLRILGTVYDQPFLLSYN